MTALLACPESASMSLAPADHARLTGPRRAWTLGVLCVSLILVMGNVTAFNTALPDIARDTGASQVVLTWIVEAYTLVLAATLLIAGAIGDRYGRRGTLLVGLTLFAAGAAMPLLIGSAGWLVAWRAVSGLGAAFILPSTLSLITTLFPPEMRSRAVGIWAGTAAMGGALGIIFAGAALEVFQWQSIFAGAAILATLAFVASLTLPTSRDPERVPVDIRGGMVSAATVGALVLGIIEGPTWGWLSARTIAVLVAGLAGAVIFFVVELANEHPLLDVRLLKVRPFRTGTLAIFFTFVALFGFLLVVVQFLQFVRGYSPLRSGLAIVPIAATLMPISVTAPALTKRVGLRAVLVLAMLFIAQSLGLLVVFASDGSFHQFLISMLCLGVGLGLGMAPATEALVANVSEAKQGVASAVNDAAREVAAALGIALAGSLLSSSYRRTFNHTSLLLPPTVYAQARSSVAAALTIAGHHNPVLANDARQAFTVAMHDSLTAVLAVLCVGGLLVALVAPGPSSPDPVSAADPIIDRRRPNRQHLPGRPDRDAREGAPAGHRGGGNIPGRQRPNAHWRAQTSRQEEDPAQAD